MSDFTVDDTMSEIRYEIDVREIFNDIQSEIGVLIPETVVDADATYSWKYWKRTPELPPTGETWSFLFTASVLEPIADSWELRSMSAWYFVGEWPNKERYDYFDYNCVIAASSDDRTKAVEVTNTGSRTAHIRFELWYKYLTADKVTHEELFPQTLEVRSVSNASILKYGRRVMPLTWAEGTEEGDMQSIVDHYLTKHEEPVPRLRVKVLGTTDALLTQIFIREISDTLTIVSANLGINADYYIEAISIKDGHADIPSCTWIVEKQRAEEGLTIFTIDTSFVDSEHIIGS